MAGQKHSHPHQRRVVHYEAILQEIGQFGPWQKWCIIWLWIPSILTGMLFMPYSFALATPDRLRCFIPECDSANGTNPVDAPWISSFIPPDERGGFSQCLRIHPDYQKPGCPVDAQIDWDNIPTVKCDSYVYDKSVYNSTLVTDFNLVCGRRHLKSFIGMAFVIVLGIGAALIGLASDLIGRKLTIVLSCAISTTMYTLIGFSNNFTMFFALYMLGALTLNGTYLSPYVLTVELVGPNYAALCSFLINFPFVLGELIIIVVAYFFRNFRHMYFVAFVPTYIFLAIWFLIPESPRWLLSEGREKEAKKIISKGAKKNGIEMSDAKLAELIDDNVREEEEEEESEPGDSDRSDEQKLNLLDLFKNACMRKRLVIMYVNWIAVVMCYGGLTLNNVNLGGNVYLNMALGVIIEIPSYIFCILSVDRIGRKPILLLMQLLTAACTFACLFIQLDDARSTPIVVLSTVAKFGATAAFSVVLLQPIELFPTTVRNTALGSCSLFSRIGGILAPFITNLGPGYEKIPFLFFCTSSFLGFLTGILLPETRRRPLPVTLRDAEAQDDDSDVTCLKWESVWTNKAKRRPD